MKFYIQLVETTFVCIADSPAEAIAKLWRHRIEHGIPATADDAEVEASYLVHTGRLSEARVVSSGPAYWIIEPAYRPLVRRWIEETSPYQYQHFCEQIVEAAPSQQRGL